MKRTQYPIHPDFKKWAHMNPPLNPVMIPVMQKLMGLLVLQERSTPELTVEQRRIALRDGSVIRALLYTPKGIGGNAPCLVYYHGGGFVLPAAPYHYNLAREYARRAYCKVLFVEYRLAPKYKFPIPPEDCFAAYCWVVDHAEELSVDPTRIAVAGDSAGGQLAAVVCMMAKDRGKSLPCGQMLLYPAAGNVETESAKKYTDTPMCSSKDMAKYSRLYMPEGVKSVYASPIEAKSLAGLPAAYIETAQFDPLRDGGILYARRLQKEGVPAELHNTEGTIHGFDIELKSPIVRACVDRRIAFLKNLFGE